MQALSDTQPSTYMSSATLIITRISYRFEHLRTDSYTRTDHEKCLHPEFKLDSLYVYFTIDWGEGGNDFWGVGKNDFSVHYTFYSDEDGESSRPGRYHSC